jgi:prepilin-type N-terminal cleavage/methylation domain-containing protein
MNRRGYSMIELLIVIIIFSMLTLATFPTISRVTSHSRANQAASVVAQDLAQAVTVAMRQRKPVRLARGSDMKSITLSDRASGTVLSKRALGTGDAYGLDSVSLSVSPVDIFPNGFTSSALTVTLWSGTYSRQVTMSRAGWVRVP